MEAFRWTPCFVTGLTDVDVQHRGLVDLINHFGALITREEGAKAADVAEVLDRLTRYAHHHFIEEAGGNSIVVGMPDDGLVAEYLHEFGGKTGGRVTGRYHGDLLHTKGKSKKAKPQSGQITNLLLFIFDLILVKPPNCKRSPPVIATGRSPVRRWLPVRRRSLFY